MIIKNLTSELQNSKIIINQISKENNKEIKNQEKGYNDVNFFKFQKQNNEVYQYDSNLKDTIQEISSERSLFKSKNMSNKKTTFNLNTMNLTSSDKGEVSFRKNAKFVSNLTTNSR